MKKGLDGFAGREAVFIDANIFLHHAFGANNVSADFLKKVESTNIKAYTSALVMEELTFKLLIQSASNFMDGVTLEKAKKLLKDRKKRDKVMGPVEKYIGYINTLKDFGLRVLDLTAKDMDVSLEKIKRYGLITADAAHLAVMERKGIKHIASSDRDFYSVDDITVWSPE